MLNLNLFKTVSDSYRFVNRNNANCLQGVNSNYKNLSPLSKDTISFTSNSAQLNKSLVDAFENKDVCRQVYENAKIPENNLRKILNNALNPYVFSKKNPHGSIQKITARIKGVNSMREKIAGELEYAITEDKTKFFSPMDPDDIKDTLGDIIGARITLRKSDPNQTTKIINSLIKEVEARRLKITRIENYEPENISDALKYFKREDLVRLKDAANKYRAPGQKPVELAYKSKKSGYMALHLDVDLSSQDYLVKNNGYKGEIQIIGSDVEKLKDVEDFCYKLKQGKAIKGGHKAYSAFGDFYAKYTDKEKYPDIDKYFLEYTAKAYLFQRKKEPIHANSNQLKVASSLPTIAQCNMQDKIPPELDFNKLARIKQASDALYEETREL